MPGTGRSDRDEAGEVARLADLASLATAGPRGRHVAAIGSRAAEAVQGLALQRAFLGVANPATRVLVVRLVQAIAEAGRRREAR